MRNRIIADQDAIVADWAFNTLRCKPMLYNKALGILNGRNELVGAVMFTGWNGSEVEVHFYGPGTLRRGIVRTIFDYALHVFNVNKLVVRTRKASMSRGVAKLGAEFEGRQRRVYGPTDGDTHAANQFAFFREHMQKFLGEL